MMNVTEMNNSNATVVQTLKTEEPILPTLDVPPDTLDPANPLAWVLCLTLLLSNMDEVINATAKLVRAIAALNQNDDENHDSQILH